MLKNTSLTFTAESRQTQRPNATALRLLGCSVALSGMMAATGAQATPVTVQNFSFETPVKAVNTYNSNMDGTGWSQGPFQAGVQFFALGSQGYNQATATSPLPGTANGLQAVYVNRNNADNYIYQDVGPLSANTTYTLTVAAGNQPNFGPGSTGSIALVSGAFNGTVLAKTTVSGQPARNFVDFTTSFSSGPSVSGDLFVVLRVTSGDQIDFDNVRLDASAASVPEPASMLLLGAGLLGLGAARRRRA
jgi:PEP-CTERM motif